MGCDGEPNRFSCDDGSVMKLRHAVAWNRSSVGEKAGKELWCFTYRNMKPSEDAVSDRTLCGRYVSFRSGSAKLKEPTCPDCLKKLRKASR